MSNPREGTNLFVCESCAQTHQCILDTLSSQCRLQERVSVIELAVCNLLRNH